jgi:hypothetical protein
MELACARRLYAVAPSAAVRCGSAVALGTPLHSRLPDSGPSPSERFGTFAGTRHTCEAAKTLWSLPRTAQRPPLGPGEALPGHQEDCLRLPGGSIQEFCDGLILHHKTTCG